MKKIQIFNSFYDLDNGHIMLLKAVLTYSKSIFKNLFFMKNTRFFAKVFLNLQLLKIL